MKEVDNIIRSAAEPEDAVDVETVDRSATTQAEAVGQRREEKARRLNRYRAARLQAGPHYEYATPTGSGRDIRRTSEVPSPDEILALRLEAGAEGKRIEVSFGNWEQATRAHTQPARSANYLVVRSEDEDWATAVSERLKKAIEPCERSWPDHLRGSAGDAAAFAALFAVYALVAAWLGTWPPDAFTLFLAAATAGLLTWVSRPIRAVLFPPFEYDSEHKSTRAQKAKRVAFWLVVVVALEVALSVVGNRLDAALFGA